MSPTRRRAYWLCPHPFRSVLARRALTPVAQMEAASARSEDVSTTVSALPCFAVRRLACRPPKSAIGVFDFVELLRPREIRTKGHDHPLAHSLPRSRQVSPS